MIRTINTWLNWLIVLTPRWLPALLLVPVLYLIGWIKAKTLTLFGLPADAVSLVGTLFSFLMFVVLMPRWVRMRWRRSSPWQTLGLRGSTSSRSSRTASFLRGLLWAGLLLTLVVVPLALGHWVQWQRQGSWRLVADALLLLFGVGLAEELIFRGWLWEELNQLLGPRAGMIGQALIFSLVHTRFNLGVWPMLGLLTGLFLLGLVLALRRRLDHGSLWGCIGLHGGLVSGWFLLDKCSLQILPNAPIWIIGPGGNHPNPLGGTIAITGLSLLLLLIKISKSTIPINNELN